MAKFDRTFCSQCGGEFGPGDEGFSHCDQHTGLVDTDADELDAEEFYALSDTQQDAVLNREMKNYSDMLDRMTPQQLYRHRRHFTLDVIRRQRSLVKEFPYIFKDKVRDSQRRLLKWRIEYRTGAVVGHG